MNLPLNRHCWSMHATSRLGIRAEIDHAARALQQAVELAPRRAEPLLHALGRGRQPLVREQRVPVDLRAGMRWGRAEHALDKITASEHVRDSGQLGGDKMGSEGSHAIGPGPSRAPHKSSV